MEAAAAPQAPPGPQGAVCLEVSGVDQTSPASSKKGQLNAFFSASGMTVTLKVRRARFDGGGSWPSVVRVTRLQGSSRT